MAAFNKNQIALFVLLAGILLVNAGCSKASRYFSSGKDNAEPPAELINHENTINIQREWSSSAGSGIGKLSLRLRPFVAGDTVYTADQRGRVFAVAVKTGQNKWSVDTKKKVVSGPTVSKSVVLVGTSRAELIALSAVDGKQLWIAEVASEVLAPPVVSDTLAVVRSIDGTITGVNLKTGKVEWNHIAKAPPLTVRGNSTPVINGDRAYVGFDSGKLACINLRNGQLVWERTISIPKGRTDIERMTDIDSDPVIQENVLYVSGFQGQMAALSLDNGQAIWDRKASSFKNIAVDDKNIYLTDENSDVIAYNKNTGDPAWKQAKLHARKLTGPAYTENYVVVGDYQGYLHWIRKSNGQIVARVRGDSSGYHESPVVSNGLLIALARSGKLSAFKVVK